MYKWKILGYVAAIFNPIPTGLLAGYFLYKEAKYKETGRNVIILSIVWFVIVIVLTALLSKMIYMSV